MSAAQRPQLARIVLKIKATDGETSNMINKVAQSCGGKLATVYERFKYDIGLRYCHVRELEIARLTNDARLVGIMPRVYYVWRDDQHEIFVLAMEVRQ